ncbi:FMN-binding protein [Cryobacterium psychrophilum]|uniref:FMN-binding protein n=2 Tax=Cryobacterium psychrophilum TaxID=41988 RepID=A0A4Y8KRN5_9MICO|nr:FMN-binding protein [Cryobacterium psychrophilum]
MVLAAGYQFGVQSHAIDAANLASASVASAAASGATPAPSDTTAGAASSAAGTGSAKPSSVSGTFTGASERTRFGNVQVQITVANSTITDVSALQLTNADGRSVAISNYAAPVLRQEALSAQSAHVQSVSGATYTSNGYLSSLQSALDQAGI